MSNYNNPYIWGIPKNYPSKQMLDYKWRLRKTDRFIFMQAHTLPFDTGLFHLSSTLQDPKDYDLQFETEACKEKVLKYDILPNNSGSPIVNIKVVNLLRVVCPHDFQAFPVKIVSSPKIEPYENNDYYLLNITHEIDSVDREQSYLELGNDGIDIEGIKKLFFRPGCMGDTHLAREKYFHPLIILSPTLVAAFKKHKMKGGNFLTDRESYNDSFPDEYLEKMYPIHPEGAKRFLVSQMNSTKEYEFFKTRVHKVPKEIMLALIEMTLSRSSFHKEQCEELLKIINNA